MPADAHQPATRLIVGIDEAGYGPRLGPLIIAAAALRAPIINTDAHATAPLTTDNLWDRLHRVVCRSRQEATSTRCAVDDSKKLKGAKGAKTHPLRHLERGVLAFLPSEHAPADDEHLMNALDAHAADDAPAEPLAWYTGEPLALPLASTREELSLLRSKVHAECAAQHVAVREVACRVIDERRFNAGVAELGSKARVSFRAVGHFIARVLHSHAAHEDAAPPLVVVDRQGGRTHYARALAGCTPCAVETINESTEQSRYILTAPGEPRRRVHVLFRVQAESEHLPVALASMTAKLVRELHMIRFNRYWSSRIRELKPTAGYATDAARWLRDAASALDARTREALVRRS